MREESEKTSRRVTVTIVPYDGPRVRRYKVRPIDESQRSIQVAVHRVERAERKATGLNNA